MHRPVLLAVGVEADNVIFAIELRYIPRELMLFGVEAAEDAFESEIERDVADLGAGLLEQFLCGAHRISRIRNGEDHSLVDRAKKFSDPSGLTCWIDRA